MGRLNDSTILVTGGTGSFGRRFIRQTLQRFNPKKLIIFSRDEMKQEQMARDLGDDERLRFFLGDVRDKDRLQRACQGVDYIIHAAALKIVPTAEYNPFECIKTNVFGAMNVIDCAINAGVKRVVALSTDKACNPINLYGATKLCSDKLFVGGNVYAGRGETRFVVVRYGNVLGSRGSIVPLFRSLAATGAEIPVTHKDMTRFIITLDQGVDMVFEALDDSLGGEIYVKKIPSMRVMDIAKILAPHCKIKIVGIRPGEKLHEQMINKEDARFTYEYEGYYKIFPQLRSPDLLSTKIEERDSPIRSGKQCEEGFSYSSDTNNSWMTPEELLAAIEGEDSSARVGQEYGVTSSSR